MSELKLPRRANKIRELAAQMGADLAHKTLTQVEARQAVSDRIGYALAMALGAALSYFVGWWAVALLAVFYAIAAYGAYRRWKALLR